MVRWIDRQIDVYVHVRMYVCVYVCMYVSMQACMHICALCVYTYIYIYIYYVFLIVRRILWLHGFWPRLQLQALHCKQACRSCVFLEGISTVGKYVIS